MLDPIHIKSVVTDLNYLTSLPTSNSYKKMALSEHPFDLLLLSLSPLYRQSRELYTELGGTFYPRVCSTMRGLSAQDLLKDEIDYTPSKAEWTWFREFGHNVADSSLELSALMRFNEISLFHEQNHRVIWRILPPPPKERRDLSRYLNFAESLVVALDLALGDQLGRKISGAFERLKLIYRPGGHDDWHKKSKKIYRQYLMATLCTTYYTLETLHPDDILGAVNYILPGQKAMNKVAVHRGLQLSELFTRVTNPEWQKKYWKEIYLKLSHLKANSKEKPLYLPEDPLDLEDEFAIMNYAFDIYGL